MPNENPVNSRDSNPSIQNRNNSSDKNRFDKLIDQLKFYASSELSTHTFLLATSVFLCMLLYTLQRSDNPFVHDSYWYWELSKSFTVNDQFSMTNFQSDLRGYLFPFILFLIRLIAGLIHVNAETIFYIFSSLFFVIVSVYILPWFGNTLFGWKKHLVGRAVVALFLFFFWRGHFLYPLSDFPAFASLLIGLSFFANSLRNSSGLGKSLFAGFFLGAASNIRPVYQVSLLLLFTVALAYLLLKKKAHLFLWLVFFIFGTSTVLAPQYLINNEHFQKRSPWVQARFGGDENLYVKQLFWGLKTQKFETNIGENFQSTVVDYREPFQQKLQKTNLMREKSFSRYLKITRRFPLDMATLYFRHLFNGLDIFFPTPYVKNIFVNHFLLSSVNYLVWLLCAYYLLKIDVSHINILSTIGVISILSPVILAIPTAIEVRFFLPLHMLAYGVVAFDLDLSNLLKSIQKNKWEMVRIIFVCVLWFVLCFTISTGTIENLVS